MTSKIEWTEETWNPITGCTKISDGCKYCYAETMARRLQAMGVKGYENGFKLTLQPDRLLYPLLKKKPTCYFVNSMSDLFHKDIPYTYIDKVIETIEKTPQHRYQILTKRAEIMAHYFSTRKVPNNVWLGVTVENKKSILRIDYLRKINTKIRFISAEPLLEDLGKINLSGLHWFIVGGESGHNARIMCKEWVLNIKEQCEQKNVAFFFKQWGGNNHTKKKNGRLLDGKLYDAMPVIEEVQKC